MASEKEGHKRLSQAAKEKYESAQEAAAKAPGPFVNQGDEIDPVATDDEVRPHKGLTGLATKPENAFGTFKIDKLAVNPKPSVRANWQFRLCREDKLNDKLNMGWVVARSSDFVEDNRLPSEVTISDGSSVCKRNELIIIKMPKKEFAAYKHYIRSRTAAQTSSIIDKAIMLGCKRPPGQMGGGIKAKLIFPGERIPRTIKREEVAIIEDAFEEMYG